MVFFKNIEVRDQKTKYGGTQRGLFAMEKINPGEKIWYCECGEEDGTFTSDELLHIIDKYSQLEYFVRSFSYMIDDDLYAMPLAYHEEKNNDECALFNHSCSPNCGFDSTGNGIVAIRTILPDEELNYHYGFLETEKSLIHGMQCKCDSNYCDKTILFSYYRDADFVKKYFNYFSPYLKQKAIDMKTRWYSSKCYVKRLSNDKIMDKESWQTCLYSACDLKKDELIARFSNDNILPENHFIRHSLTPNCYVIGRDVFTNMNVPSEAELTLYYHGVLL